MLKELLLPVKQAIISLKNQYKPIRDLVKTLPCQINGTHGSQSKSALVSLGTPKEQEVIG